ncbi:hypothetical protein NITMOv2_1398 [Nitrospira moscoviensis]|uniref:Uncharacterized protein n=1 Tax=Nitrospira moscoviensis TaxID=42253 RepID=A0A0K2GA51_NITMO|nr:hypothetical protein NITMOv2_1398 [Nitrospira moscoviensis]
MKISTAWGGNKARKRKRPVQRLKIRWDLLGFQPASQDDESPSIEDIRRQVSSLASTGFGQETRLRSVAKKTADRSGPGVGRITGARSRRAK